MFYDQINGNNMNQEQMTNLIQILIKIALLVVVTAFIVMFQKSNTIIFIGLLLFILYIYFYLHVNLFFLIIVGFGGSFTEAIVICLANDLWTYKEPGLGNIPIWLPLLWSIVGTGVIGLYDLSKLISPN